jgi:septal ring factor EnvC (AmiA/AmiB activator)
MDIINTGKCRTIANKYFFMNFKEIWLTDPQLLLSVVTIVLSVISIVIAILSSRSTSKAAAKQIESLKQLVEKQGQEIKEVEKLSSLLVKSDIEALNIEILRLKTELAGIDIEINVWNEKIRVPFSMERHFIDNRYQYGLLKKKRDLLEKQIETLQERIRKLVKGETM